MPDSDRRPGLPVAQPLVADPELARVVGRLLLAEPWVPPAPETPRVDVGARRLVLESCGVDRYLPDDPEDPDNPTRLVLEDRLVVDPEHQVPGFIRQWVESGDVQRRPIAVLLGTVGRGKTCSLAWLHCKYNGGRYVVASEAARIFGQRYGTEWRALRDAHTLSIDDIGRHPRAEGDDFAEVLCEICDARLGGGRVTALASNLAAREFGSRYLGGETPEERERKGDRLASRLHQSAVFHSDNGPDLRRTNAGKDMRR